MRNSVTNPLMTNIVMFPGTTSSYAVDLKYIEGAAVHIGYSSIGSAGVTGSFSIQGSCEQVQPVGSLQTLSGTKSDGLTQYLPWATLTGSNIQFSGTVVQPLIFNGPSSYYQSLRLQCTTTGGSGSFSARVSVKGV